MSLVKTNQLTNLNNDGKVEVLEGLTIPSAKEISIGGPLKDGAGSVGAPDAGATQNKVLTSTGTTVAWANPTDLNTTYNISAIDRVGVANSKGIRLTDSPNSNTDDVFLAGDTNILLTRTETPDVITFGLVQNISTTSDVQFNNITSIGEITFSNTGCIKPASTTGKISWNSLEGRWQFTNDGTNYYNFILPTETVYDVASQYGASGDETRYIISTTSTETISSQSYLKVQFTDANAYTKFDTLQHVKIFGASTTATNSLPGVPTGTMQVTAAAPDLAAARVANTNQYYGYAFCSFGLENGDISTGTSTGTANVVENVAIRDFNASNYNTLSITRNNVSNGILVYRTIGTQSQVNSRVTSFSSNRGSFHLVAVLGPKEFGSSTVTTYKDYGGYDVPSWSSKNLTDTVEYGSYNTPVHIPNNPPGASKRGWAVGAVKSVDSVNNAIIIDVPGLIANGGNDSISVYHDDTSALQTAINELSTDGTNFLIIPGGTYLISQLELPDGFALRGLDDSTVLKKQHWTYGPPSVSKNGSNVSRNGVKNSMFISSNFRVSVNSSTWGLKDFTLRDMTIDGNVISQYLYEDSDLGVDANNAAICIPNSDFVKIKDVKVRNTSGPAIFAEGSINMSISGSSIFNGMETERYGTSCVEMSECENTNIASCFFRNYPGGLDLTTGKVLSINGSVIRNCGSGLQVYGTVNSDVLDNIILGPADEFLAVPDLYDSDFDGVNLSIQNNVDNDTPVYKFESRGEPKDLSNTIIKFEVYKATGASKNIDTGVVTPESIDYNNELTSLSYGRITAGLDSTVGELKFRYPSGNTSNYYSQTLNTDQYFVYEIKGIDYYVPEVDSIAVGSDLNPVFGSGTSRAEDYVLIVTSNNAYGSIVEGDYIKLVGNQFGFATSGTVWRVAEKFGSVNTDLKIRLTPFTENTTNGVLTSAGSITGTTGTEIGGGYYELRQQYSIARGVISRTP